MPLSNEEINRIKSATNLIKCKLRETLTGKDMEIIGELCKASLNLITSLQKKVDDWRFIDINSPELKSKKLRFKELNDERTVFSPNRPNGKTRQFYHDKDGVLYQHVKTQTSWFIVCDDGFLYRYYEAKKFAEIGKNFPYDKNENLTWYKPNVIDEDDNEDSDSDIVEVIGFEE